jgi:hypothetical protein
MGETAVNQAMRVLNSPVQRIATNPGSQAAAMGYGSASATLDILPINTKRHPYVGDWINACQRLGQIASLQPGWNGTRGISPDRHTLSFAATELAALERLGIPAPTINPSPDGALYLEWHANDIDLEIIFEAPYRIVLLFEDARHLVPPYAGECVDLTPGLEALKALSARLDRSIKCAPRTLRTTRDCCDAYLPGTSQ